MSKFDPKAALDQLTLSNNGTGRLAAMVGANGFVSCDADRWVQFGFKSCRKSNKCRIEYDAGADLYNLVFFKYSTKTYECPEVKRYDGLGWDQLKPAFENFTGLYVSL